MDHTQGTAAEFPGGTIVGKVRPVVDRVSARLEVTTVAPQRKLATMPVVIEASGVTVK